MLRSPWDAEAAAAAALRAAAAASIHQILTGLCLCGLSHRLCLRLTSKSLSHGQMKAKRALVVVATTEQLWNYFNGSSVTVMCMCLWVHVSVCVCVCVHAHTPQPSWTATQQPQPLKWWLKSAYNFPLQGCSLQFLARKCMPLWSSHWSHCHQHEVCVSLCRTEGKN